MSDDVDTIREFVGESLDEQWSVGGYCFINTLEGRMNAYVGDWIIRGVKGEFYPCKPDIFAATYEPVVSGGTSTGSARPTEPAVCEFVARGDFYDCAHAGGGRGSPLTDWCKPCLRGRVVLLKEALRDLHAEVEMAESIGICLPDRVPSLRAAAALADAEVDN